jgi:quercetin dioxygenase-like cupin family protein
LLFTPPSPTRNFELFQNPSLTPAAYTNQSATASGPRSNLVSKGELTVEIGDSRYVLAEGDAVSFDATGRHAYINSGEGRRGVIVINYYPRQCESAGN